MSSSTLTNIFWSFPPPLPLIITTTSSTTPPASYPHNSTRYALDSFLSSSPPTQHLALLAADLVQPSWSVNSGEQSVTAYGGEEDGGFSLGLYCLACLNTKAKSRSSSPAEVEAAAVAGGEENACFRYNNTGAHVEEVWVDVDIVPGRAGAVGMRVEMPGAEGGKKSEKEREEEEEERGVDYACVFELKRQVWDGVAVSSPLLVHHAVAGSDGNSDIATATTPNFYNATYPTGVPVSQLSPSRLVFPPPSGYVRTVNTLQEEEEEPQTVGSYIASTCANTSAEFWGPGTMSQGEGEAEEEMIQTQDVLEPIWTSSIAGDFSFIYVFCLVCRDAFAPEDHTNTNLASACSSFSSDAVTQTMTQAFVPRDNKKVTSLALQIPELERSLITAGNRTQPPTMLYACAVELDFDSYATQSAFSRVFFATHHREHTREQWAFNQTVPQGGVSGKERGQGQGDGGVGKVKTAHHGTILNQGTKAGIGIGTVLGVGMLGYLTWVWWGKRKDAKGKGKGITAENRGETDKV